MLYRRTAVALGIVALATAHPQAARAQGVVTCAKIVWEFAGKYFTAGMAQASGGMAASYLADKLKGQGEVKVNRADIQNLIRMYKQQGISECELREALETIYGR